MFSPPALPWFWPSPGLETDVVPSKTFATIALVVQAFHWEVFRTILKVTGLGLLRTSPERFGYQGRGHPIRSLLRQLLTAPIPSFIVTLPFGHLEQTGQTGQTIFFICPEESAREPTNYNIFSVLLITVIRVLFFQRSKPTAKPNVLGSLLFLELPPCSEKLKMELMEHRKIEFLGQLGKSVVNPWAYLGVLG